MKIDNLNIHGGNQQFADIIINSSPQLDETDRGLVQLIHDNVDTEEERKKLLRNLTTTKMSDAPEAEKKKAGSALRKFIDSLATESGKQIVKELAENGVEYLQYIM